MDESERKKIKSAMQTLSDIREVLMELHLGSKDELLKELVEYYDQVENKYNNGVVTVEEIEDAIKKFYPTIDQAIDEDHEEKYK